MITVRPAVTSDIPHMSRVLNASITELCGLDHRNDPAVVAAWTRNKSEDGVAAMLRAPNSELFVAERNGAVAAVGSILGGNCIGLNYVDPVHRFAGVSDALLAALEALMRERGVTEAKLESTATARRFYLARGWREPRSPPGAERMVETYAMTKQL